VVVVHCGDGARAARPSLSASPASARPIGAGQHAGPGVCRRRTGYLSGYLTTTPGTRAAQFFYTPGADFTPSACLRTFVMPDTGHDVALRYKPNRRKCDMSKRIIPRPLRRAALTLSAMAVLLGVTATAAFAWSATGTDGHYLWWEAWGSSSGLNVEFNTNADSFEGHFELQTPSHGVLNTGDQEWWAGNTPDVIWSEPPVKGSYCLTAWGEKSGGYVKLGYACFNFPD
jgi:hypothetical protein